MNQRYNEKLQVPEKQMPDMVDVMYWAKETLRLMVENGQVHKDDVSKRIAALER